MEIDAHDIWQKINPDPHGAIVTVDRGTGSWVNDDTMIAPTHAFPLERWGAVCP